MACPVCIPLPRQRIGIVLGDTLFLTFGGHGYIIALLRKAIRARLGIGAFQVGQSLHPVGERTTSCMAICVIVSTASTRCRLCWEVSEELVHDVPCALAGPSVEAIPSVTWGLRSSVQALIAMR